MKYPLSVHENDRAFKCNHCDKAFKLNQELKVHIASVHEGKNPYECSICSKKFSRPLAAIAGNFK